MKRIQYNEYDTGHAYSLRGAGLALTLTLNPETYP